jgi:hypothetical protein
VFRTGDMMLATVPFGRRWGVHKGRVAERMSGNFNLQSCLAGAEPLQGIAHQPCRLLKRADGYGYAWQTTLSQQPSTK